MGFKAEMAFGRHKSFALADLSSVEVVIRMS